MTGPGGLRWLSITHPSSCTDDGYTYIGTTNGKNMAGYTFQNSYEYAFSNLGYPVYNMNIASYVVRAEAENCEKINDLGYKVTANQEVSELTIWVDRPVLTVTWKDIAGNTIKTGITIAMTTKIISATINPAFFSIVCPLVFCFTNCSV